MQKYRYVGSILLLAIALPVLVSCGKPKETNSSSTIRIQAPGHQKVGTLAALPVGRKPCYGVNITAADIPNVGGGQCSPIMGIAGGFVEANSNLELTVPYGINRKLDLYLYLLPGPTGSCPALAENIPAADIQKIYLLGSVPSFEINSPETQISITANFPGESTNIAVQNSYPAVCGGQALSNPNKFSLNSGGGVATGAGIVLKARIGKMTSSEILTGSGIQLKVK